MQTDEHGLFPSRRSPRLKHYDYAQPNYYFVTICTYRKSCIFGGPQKLSPPGTIAKEAFDMIQNHFPDAQVHKCVVMPNHVHAIVQIKKAGTDLSAAIGQYKSFVTKHIHQINPNLMVWQDSFHDHVIRNEQDYQRIWQYIDTNPQKWQEDCFYTNHNG